MEEVVGGDLHSAWDTRVNEWDPHTRVNGQMAKGVATATPILFYFYFFIKKIKNLGVIWEVLDTICQTAKIWNFGGVDCKN